MLLIICQKKIEDLQGGFWIGIHGKMLSTS